MSLGHPFVKDCVPQTMSHMNPSSVSCFRQVFYQSHVENSKCALPMSIMRKTQNTQDTSAQGSTAQEQRRSLPTPQLCCPYLCLGAVEPSSLQQSFPPSLACNSSTPKWQVSHLVLHTPAVAAFLTSSNRACSKKSPLASI